MKDDRGGFAVPVDGERELLVAERMRAELGGFRVGLAVEGDQLGRIAVHDFKQRAENFVVAGDAGLVVLEHVQLDQQAGAVFEDHLAGGEARRIGVEAEALRGIGVVVEVMSVGKASGRRH